ncbi:hypothetical protein JCM19233_115 [Vibrio astriarenae]|nr:hypothetical protein JCM19233_115 [Vibrio sp. C7]
MTNFVKVGAAVAFVGSLVDMTAYQWYQHEAYSHHRDKLLDELDYLSLVSTERGISEIREVYAIESDNETQYLEHRVLVTPFKFNGQLKSQNERSSLIWYSDGSSYLANGYLHNFATPTFTMSNVELESGGQIGKFELGITAHSVVFDNGDAHLALTRPTLSVNVGKSLEQPGARIALSTERILYQEGDTEFVANAITANGSAFLPRYFY